MTHLATLSHLALRALMTTWRTSGPGDQSLRELWRTQRAILVTYHGMLLHLLAFARLPAANGRRVVLMLGEGVSAGGLGDLDQLGIRHLYTSDGGDGAAWEEFGRHVEDGHIGIVPADAPDGVRGIGRADVLRLARRVRASLGLAVTTASRSIGLPFWNGAELPAPLSRVELSLQLLPPPEDEDEERVLAVLDSELRDAARKIGAPDRPLLTATAPERPQPSRPSTR